MHRVWLRIVLLLAIVAIPGLASAQPPPATSPLRAGVAPQWDAGVNLGLLFLEGDPLMGGAWGFVGSGRLTDVVALAGVFGKQGYGYAHCKGTVCLPGVRSSLCPCDEFPSDQSGHTSPYRLFSGRVALVGPRVWLGEVFYSHLLVGAVSPDKSPALFAVRPGIGADVGGASAAFRFEVDYDIVPRYGREAGLSGLRMFIGLVVRHP